MITFTTTNRRQFLSAAFTLVGLVGAGVAGCGGSKDSGGVPSVVPQGNAAVRAIAIAATQSLAGGRAYPLAAVRIAAPAGSQFTSRAAAHRDVPTTIVYDNGLQLYKKYSTVGSTLSVSYYTDAAATIPAGSASVTQNGGSTFTNDYSSYPTKVDFTADTSDGTVPFSGTGSITYLDASGANTLTGSFISKRNHVTLSGTLNLDGAGNVTGSMAMVQGTVATKVTGITGQLSGDLIGTITSDPYGWSGNLRFNLNTGMFTLTLDTNTGAASATVDASGNLSIQFADGTNQTIVNPLNEFLDGTQSGTTPIPTPSAPPTPAMEAYTAVLLQSTAFINSAAASVSGSSQVGNGFLKDGFALGTHQHALLWSGSAASVVDLHPAGFDSSYATGVSGDTQVGYGNTGGGTYDKALLWKGTADSMVDLSVPGGGNARVTGVSGNTQVGVINLNKAVLWTGTAASAVFLTPKGFIDSIATGVSGEFQVGYGDISFGGTHALLWKGTADSAIDLHPTGLYATYATAVSGNTQVGYSVTNEHAEQQAVLWTGSAASMVLLHPANCHISQVNAVSGNMQVGQGQYSSGPDQANAHAFLWTGTAASVVDLHPFTLSLAFNGTALNPVSSVANGIDSNGNIVGYVTDFKDTKYAVLWVKN